MGPTPVYGARAEKPLQNADFAMKQTNICRLSGDIITLEQTFQASTNRSGIWKLEKNHEVQIIADFMCNCASPYTTHSIKEMIYIVRYAKLMNFIN